MATLDYGKRYANGKASNRPIQQAIVHKNPMNDKKVMRVSVLERSQADLSHELSFTKIN